MSSWANNETFLVYKHITDEGDLSDVIWGEASDLYHGDENPMESLADWLRDRIMYDDNPLGVGTLYFELIESVLKEVDWYEIASMLLKRIAREE